MNSRKTRIEQLERQLRETVSAMRDLFFVNILMGGVYETEESLCAAAARVDIAFPNGNFLVLIAKKEHWGELYTSGRSDVREQHFILRNALENGFSSPCFAANVHGEMTAVLNLSELPAAGVRGIMQDASHILEVLDREFGISITVAISRVYHSVMELPQAYQDARHLPASRWPRQVQRVQPYPCALGIPQDSRTLYHAFGDLLLLMG